MLQPNSDFFFGRPMTYYGSFEDTEDETESEEASEWTPFFLEMNSNNPIQQSIGLYLHWFEI